MISVVVPAHRADAALDECLRALASSSEPHETIVVDDGSAGGAVAAMARARGGTYVRMETSAGPAAARNRGRQAATGDVLLFVDSDVVVRPDTIATVSTYFAAHPDIGALFGSYDASPGAGTLVSRFKNLTHHYVHQQARDDAFTFWAGCGAIRRDAFDAVGGFDESYRRPCIEDIELGYRLRRDGTRIAVVKTLQVTHLKRWTLTGLIRTDVFDRGVPWTRLMLARPDAAANDLNLSGRARLSLALTWIALASALLVPWSSAAAGVTVAAIAVVVAIDRAYFRWLAGVGGVAFAAACVPLHLLYQLYAGVAGAIGAAGHLLAGGGRTPGADAADPPLAPHARTVARSFATLAAGELAARAFGFVATLYLARTIGVDGFGLLEIGLAALAYLQIAVDGGLDTIAIRTVAREPSQQQRFAANVLGLRLAAALVFVAIVGAIAWAAPAATPKAAVTQRYALAVIPLALSLGWAFQAGQRMRAVAAGNAITQIAYLALLVAFVKGPAQLLAVPLAYVAAVAIGQLAIAAWYGRRFGLPRPRLEPGFAAHLLRQALPVAGARGLRAVSYNFDILILGFLFPTLSVGLYAAAYRLLTLPLLGFATFFNATFPTIARLQGVARRRAAALYIAAVAACSVVVVIVMRRWPDEIMAMTAGSAFTPGADILRYLALSVPLTAISGVFRQLLLVTDRQGTDFAIVLSGAVVNASLNLALIPRLGLLGAASATVAGEAFVLLAAMAAVAVPRSTRAPFGEPVAASKGRV